MKNIKGTYINIHNRGFTLLEMIVVLVIVGMLMGLVGPKLFKQADKAKVQTAETQVKMIKGALQTMRLDINRYPTTAEGLKLLTIRPTSGRLQQLWDGPYTEDSVPLDPWDFPYQYDAKPSNNQEFSLYSFGADNQAGGEGYNADVGYLPNN